MFKKPVKVKRSSREFLPVIDQSNSFLRSLHSLWSEEQLCDITVCINNTALKAHKIVISAYSGYIRDILRASGNETLRKIQLSGMQSNIVKDILESMYSGTLALSSITIDDVLSAAVFLRIPAVVDVCSQFLSDHVNASNCLRTLQVATMYNLKFLIEDAYSVISSHFQYVSKQTDYLKLRYCEVLGILLRDDLAGVEEIKVFDAVVNWINSDKSSRANYATRLLRNIRYSLIPEQELQDKVDACPYVSFVPELAEYVREAFRYHLLPFRRPIMQDIRSQPRTSVKIPSIIACGGLALRREGAITNKVYYCNLESGEWKHLTTMPAPRHHHAAAVLEGFIYIAGGDSSDGCSSPSVSVWRYDAWADEWLRVANMNISRESFQMVTLNMKLYVVGGRTNRGTTDSVECYNPSNNEWIIVAPINSPRRHVALATLKDDIYAAGGSNDNLVSKRVERYNVATNEWERCQPMVQPRCSAGLHGFKNRLWLIGGLVPGDQGTSLTNILETPEMEVYSPTKDQWTTLKWPSWLKEPTLKCPSYSGDLSKNIFLPRNCERNDNFAIDMPRSEAGSCQMNGVIFLVAGYSRLIRARIDDVECINASLLVRGDTKPSKASLETSSRVCKPPEETPFVPRAAIHRFPRRCTGVACVPFTLLRHPGFSLKNGSNSQTFSE